MAGRKAHEATEANKRVVERGKAAGLTDEEIASVMGISSDTLVKYYGKELLESKQKVIMAVGAKVVQKALGGDNACMFFYLKTQAGWREKTEVEHSGSVKLQTVINFGSKPSA